jgi:hypothetical protein
MSSFGKKIKRRKLPPQVLVIHIQGVRVVPLPPEQDWTLGDAVAAYMDGCLPQGLDHVSPIDPTQCSLQAELDPLSDD